MLERRLGIEFKDRSLLKLALTHRSYVHEAPDDAPESNERLEYLGDAFLGFVVAEHLYRRFPGLAEGRLTALRSGLVRAATLAAVGAELGLGRRLYLGHGEETSGGRTRERNLARVFEAVLGAILLDQGYAKAKRWTLKLFKDRLESLPPDLIDDYKSLAARACASGRPPAARLPHHQGGRPRPQPRLYRRSHRRRRRGRRRRRPKQAKGRTRSRPRRHGQPRPNLTKGR